MHWSVFIHKWNLFLMKSDHVSSDNLIHMDWIFFMIFFLFSVIGFHLINRNRTGFKKNIWICVFQDIEDPDTQGCSLWLIYESSWETNFIFFRISKCNFFVKLVYEVDIPSLKLILNMNLQCLSINVHNIDDWFLKVHVNPTNLFFKPN